MKELGFDLTNCGEVGGVKITPGELGRVKKTPESMLVDLSNVSSFFVPLSSSVLCFLCLTNDLVGTFNRSSFSHAVWLTMVTIQAKLVGEYK